MPRAGWLALGAIAGALLFDPAAAGLNALAGIGGSRFAPIALGLAVVSLVGGLLTRRHWLAFVALGAALVLVRGLLVPLAAPATGVEGPAGAGIHRATVTTLYSPVGGAQRAILELDGEAGGPAARAYATLPRYPELAPTDRIEFDGRLEPPPSPESSGFGEFLARSGVAFTVRARSLSLLAGDETAAAELEHLRRAAGDAIARGLPEPQAGLAAAIVVGLRDRVARDVSTDFRIAGLSHVVAISGFHVALVAGLAGALLRPLARRPRALVLILLLAGYALLAGASPSVLRATLMAGTVLVVRETGRRSQAAAALGIAVSCLLLAEPAIVGQVGFQLSVAATAGLLRWGGSFAAWLGDRLPAAVPRLIVETMAVSLAAQLATLPLVLLHFGRLSLVAPLSNLLAAPLIAPSMASAGAALAGGGLVQAGTPELLAGPLELFGAMVIGALITVARLSASLPLASVELAPPFDLLGASCAALVVLLLLLRRAQPLRQEIASRPSRAPGGRGGRRRLALVGAVALAAMVVVLAAGARPDGRLQMTVLDVGQGDAILLVGPRGSRLLIDTGPDPDLLLAQLDARLPAWDRRLDLVVLTHPHEDHVAGLALLLDRYRIAAVAEPGMVGLGPGDAAFRRRLAELGRATRILAAGDRFSFDGVDVRVHWPLPGRVPARPVDGGKAVNNVSIVLELSYGQRRLLLTGDVEEEIDRQLLSAGIGGDARPLDVLKVAHHGSATATTDAFIDRVQPQVAIVSAGWGNPYGHPAPGTIARLQEAGARVLRTDLDGPVVVSTDGRDLIVGALGGRPRPSPRPRAALGEPGLGFCPLPLLSGVSTRRRPYNRGDGRPNARRGGAHADRPRAARLAEQALGRRRRHRRIPGRPGGRAGTAG